MKNLKKGISNVIINNVVPLNNGDVALFTCLYQKLLKEGYSIKIATYNYKEAKLTYPDLPFIPELGQSWIFRKIKGLKALLLPLLFLTSKEYKKADLVIGAPGGYINSYYNLKNTLSLYKTLSKKGVKTAIYAQSVGPLNKSDENLFVKAMKNINLIMVRDSFSESYLKKLNIPSNKFIASKDLAFSLPKLDLEKITGNKIAFSLREWSHDERQKSIYFSLITSLVKIAVEKGYEIDFLSTCQGRDNYTDDSKVAQEIVNALPETLKKSCHIIKDYFTFDAFMIKLNEYDLVVGTRLHMCICSITQRIPAFNISYEIKGKECYDYLNLSQFSVDYNNEPNEASKRFQLFIEEKKNTESHLNKIVPSISKSIHKDFALFLNEISS